MTIRWEGRASRGPDTVNATQDPPDLNSRIAGGANLCVRDTNRSAPSLPIPVPTLSMPYGAKHAIPSASANTFYAAAYLPPSPPSTPPSSLDSASTAPIHFKAFNAKFERQADSFNLATSPSSSTDHLEFFGQSGTFLEAVLPNNAMARSAIPVEADGLKLALLDDDEADTRVLYAQSGVGAPSLCLRENLVALLDRADEELDCDSVIVVLNKDDQELPQLLHSLLYVGGTVLDRKLYGHSKSTVLVGIDL